MNNLSKIADLLIKLVKQYITITSSFTEREAFMSILQHLEYMHEELKNKDVEFKGLQKENKELKNKLKELSK